MSSTNRVWDPSPPESGDRLITATEAVREFGLDEGHLYAAAKKREIHAIETKPRDRRSKRWTYGYLSDEVAALAARLGKFKKP